MNPSENPPRQRLSIPELSRALNNLSQACRKGTSSAFPTEFKQKYQGEGLGALKSVPAPGRSHPRASTPEVVAKVLDLALEHPGWGCIRISEHLKTRGIPISSPTVQNILIKHSLGSRSERLSALEDRYSGDLTALSKEQLILLEKNNPCIRERSHESSRPAELLAQDTFFLKDFKHLGKIYLQTAVDTYSGYAFGFIHSGKVPDCAVALLHNDVLPFFKERGLRIAAIITNRGREYCGSPKHHFELYLTLNDIEHRIISAGPSHIHGFAERFENIAATEFFAKEIVGRKPNTVESLQAEFDRWLAFYNSERPLPGYRNFGKTPFQMLNSH